MVSGVFKACFLITDLGFLLYWGISVCMLAGLSIFDPALMYYGYGNPIIEAWNWSFFPLDILLSFFGLVGLYVVREQQKRKLIINVSAVLTFCAGFLALCFWAIVGFFDIAWWGMNLFLCLWPVVFLAGQLKAHAGDPIP